MADDPLQPQFCAQRLAALAAPERLRIVSFLRTGAKNVTEISEMLGITMVNVSHHVNVLKNAGLIQREKRGRFVLYSLCPGVLDTAKSQGQSDQINLGCCQLVLPGPDDNPPGTTELPVTR